MFQCKYFRAYRGSVFAGLREVVGFSIQVGVPGLDGLLGHGGRLFLWCEDIRVPEVLGCE